LGFITGEKIKIFREINVSLPFRGTGGLTFFLQFIHSFQRSLRVPTSTSIKQLYNFITVIKLLLWLTAAMARQTACTATILFPGTKRQAIQNSYGGVPVRIKNC
jgi:hypothetical protein